MKFTVKYNAKYFEYAVFINGDIFCHLSERDFEIFVDNFKQPIEVLDETN